MRKILYFYFYTGKNVFSKQITEVHKFWLRRYAKIFDELNFFIATDDINDIPNMVFAKERLSDVCSEVDKEKINFHFLKNTDERESQMVIREILPKMLENKNDLCFICHNKGTTNRFNQSLINWVSGLWYYSCEFISELEDVMANDDKVMYGPFKTKFKVRYDSVIQTHNVIYCGGFYWIKPSKYIENTTNKQFRFDNLKIPRYFSENVPLLLNEDCIASHNNVTFGSNEHNLYDDTDERWKETLNKCGNDKEFSQLVNQLINK